MAKTQKGKIQGAHIKSFKGPQGKFPEFRWTTNPLLLYKKLCNKEGTCFHRVRKKCGKFKLRLNFQTFIKHPIYINFKHISSTL